MSRPARPGPARPGLPTGQGAPGPQQAEERLLGASRGIGAAAQAAAPPQVGYLEDGGRSLQERVGLETQGLLGRWDTGWGLEWKDGRDIKNKRGKGKWRARRSQWGGPQWRGWGAVPTQVWARAVWHLRQSTWPSRGKQPLSSASMDSAFPQSSHL